MQGTVWGAAHILLVHLISNNPMGYVGILSSHLLCRENWSTGSLSDLQRWHSKRKTRDSHPSSPALVSSLLNHCGVLCHKQRAQNTSRSGVTRFVNSPQVPLFWPDLDTRSCLPPTPRCHYYFHPGWADVTWLNSFDLWQLPHPLLTWP